MTDKITLTNVASIDTTLVNAININNALITTAFDNTLSRDGTSPNQMGANLDMNSNQILNLPSPATVNSPARLIDVVSNPTITVPAVGTSGATVPLLNANNTFSGNNTYSGTSTFNGAATFSAITLPSNSITNSLIRQGVAKSVIGVTGNSTANVADIAATTSRQVLSVNSGGTAIAFAQPQGDQLLATVTNDNATAGNVGEYVFSNIVAGASKSLATSTGLNVTSISLTPGDWDVWGAIAFAGTGSTNFTYLSAGIGTTTATVNSSDPTQSVAFWQAASAPFPSTSFPVMQAISPQRISLSTTTTYYLNAFATFTVSTLVTYGIIQARRVR